MPNLSEGWAIVIASGLTVLGMMFVQNSNTKQREKDSRERFFYEIYPKRLALYEEVIKELQAMIESGESLTGPGLTQEAVIGKITKDTHFLINLLARLGVFGNPNSRGIFETVISKAHDFCIDLKNGDYVPLMLGGWIITIKETLDKFVQFVREDIGGNSVEITVRGHFAAKKRGLFKRIKQKCRSLFLFKKCNKFHQNREENRRHDEGTPINDER
ncbi:MAG: hypothetical protein LBF74_06155 [Treponema sp.]|jgi:hypothetical protein|nr:hypothetical protein [Treponema sp.]